MVPRTNAVSDENNGETVGFLTTKNPLAGYRFIVSSARTRPYQLHVEPKPDQTRIYHYHG